MHTATKLHLSCLLFALTFLASSAASAQPQYVREMKSHSYKGYRFSEIRKNPKANQLYVRRMEKPGAFRVEASLIPHLGKGKQVLVLHSQAVEGRSSSFTHASNVHQSLTNSKSEGSALVNKGGQRYLYSGHSQATWEPLWPVVTDRQARQQIYEQLIHFDK